jgi:hypothetical protein
MDGTCSAHGRYENGYKLLVGKPDRDITTYET